MGLRKIAPLFLSVALLLSACGATPVPLAENPEATRPVIAYVPLDDRTDNVDRVMDLAQSLGYALAMPDKDLYKTRLDHQPVNANGTPCGDRGRLLAWVQEQDKAGCDLFLLSVDQLFSGGLVNSRSMPQNEDILFPDGSLLSQHKALQQYLLPLGQDTGNTVFLLDSVMRLAPTVGYDGGDLESYNALRDYGARPRPHLEGAALTVSAIAADYPLGADGAPLPLGEELSPETAQQYLQARERKLRLSDDLLEATATLLGVHWLVGVDDSSSADSIQTNEIAYLKQAVAGRGAVLSGVDDLGTKAVCKLYSEACDLPYSATVRYFGDAETAAACIYDAQPLTQIMDDHLAYFGVTKAEPAQADLQILVLTQPADEAKKAAYYGDLIDALNENQRVKIPTILVNAGNGLYGQPFYDALTEKTDLGFLLGYSGFHDMAIVTGSALSFGLSRYLYLRCGDAADGLAQKAFVRTLVETVVKDLCYKSGARVELMAHIRENLGGSPDNFYQFGTDEAALETMLAERMAVHTKGVLQNFSRSDCIVSLSPYETLGIGTLALSEFHFPWSRVFEITMTIDVGTFTQPRR